MRCVKNKDKMAKLQNLVGAAVMANATRRRVMMILGIMVLIGLVILAVFLLKPKEDKENLVGLNIGENLIDLNINKQQACYSNMDCPDGTYCDVYGMCTPSEMLPQLHSRSVLGKGILGRGRGGEGADVQKVSDDMKGQLS